MSDYERFIQSKAKLDKPSGHNPTTDMSHLFDFQQAIVKWAIRRGRAAIFADTGLGKTAMQLTWAHDVAKHTGGNVLIIAPLCVAQQTVQEGRKFGIDVHYCRDQSSIMHGLNITNYEMIDRFDFASFAGVVLDESSILKNQTGKTRTALIESCAVIPYRLSCTATPSPNDFMELGNQSEFIGAMSMVEMLAMFFTHDGGNTSKWRLKGHGKTRFWEWLATWAMVIKKPSDIGYNDDRYILPKLHTYEHCVSVHHDMEDSDTLFPMEAVGLLDRNRARKSSIDDRVAECANMVNASDDQWVIWCHMNEESEKLEKAITGSVAVAGSDSIDQKEHRIMDFTDGRVRVLITKPSIAGFGMNWQHCHSMAFVGLSDSYEQFYQAIRRCWRFGQNSEVHVHVVVAETEGAVLSNIRRKERQAQQMGDEMIAHLRKFEKKEVSGMSRSKSDYKRDIASGDGWTIHLGDCVDVARDMDDGSVGYTVFSPPFASLYTYSNSDRDMGNCDCDDTFNAQFRFLVDELFRITAPGRLVSFHCMNLPTSKVRDGHIGIKDFRGDLIRMFIDAGFIYASEVCIWKDPVTAMQRTKALGLLHKTIRKDSSMSRMGIPDYVVTMRKPGENKNPISHGDDLPVSLWQKYASPVWDDINPSNTLNKNVARDEDDERHICPLQLDVIERCMHLWSTPGDVVFSPFSGIGSEGYVALRMGRRFIGAELKRSYWAVAQKNLALAEKDQMPLLAVANQ